MPGEPAARRPLTRKELARLIDHTLLRPTATEEQLAAHCDEATQWKFAVVSIHPTWVTFCAKRLAGTDVGVNATVGFPLGANRPRIKAEEAHDAVVCGAREVDMVINIGALKSGHPNLVEDEIAEVVEAASPAPVKVILETAYLTDAEKRAVCEMCVRAKAAFVKTSTGFGPAGATVADVALMRKVVGDRLGVKAAGGIRTLADVLAMLNAGADRIGTSSGVSILQELPQ